MFLQRHYLYIFFCDSPTCLNSPFLLLYLILFFVIKYSSASLFLSPIMLQSLEPFSLFTVCVLACSNYFLESLFQSAHRGKCLVPGTVLKLSMLSSHILLFPITASSFQMPLVCKSAVSDMNF